MAQDNLKQKTKKGLYWSAASNFANQKGSGDRYLNHPY